MTPGHQDTTATPGVDQVGGLRPTRAGADALVRARRLLAEEVVPLENRLAAELRAVGRPHPELDEDGAMAAPYWEARRHVQRRAAAEGLYAAHLSPRVGGGGLGRVDMFFLEEAVYRHGAFLAPAVLGWTEGPGPLLEHATDDQLQRFGVPLAQGDITAAFANTEPDAGSDVLAMTTRAERDGDDWVITGRKRWITNWQRCDVAQVVAVTEPGAHTRSLTIFLVEADRPGFRRGPVLPTLLDDGLTGELVLDGVRVPDANRLGEVGAGFGLAMTWINWRRLCRGGMCAGWSRLLVDRARERIEPRRAYGRTMADLQVVQHTLADMEADRYAARAASLVAQAELDELGPFVIPLSSRAKQLIALVKVINDESFHRVADRAVQLHGAAGLHKEGFGAAAGPGLEEKLFRVARNLKIPAGTVEVQRDLLARQLLAPGHD
ncbi:MAG TPA: acyl-CoA dehydrogenase [Acidimicrobiales bacterium]|nr:acyl-CoA dehydrogenase [Acidimicrobiales bacterium]